MQVDSLIWRVRGEVDAAGADGPGEVDGAAREAIVPVDRSWLATILDLAELGLAHADQAGARLRGGRMSVQAGPGSP